jgi:signal peptidase I
MFTKIKNLMQKWHNYKQHLKEKKRILTYILVDVVETIVVALILVLIIRQYLFLTSKIFSGSMEPTMQINDRLFVNKLAYKFTEPKRGDIILFKSPYNDKKDYVKRLIGLPGEKIEIKRGIIYINDVELTFPGVNVQQDYSYYGPEVIPPNSYFAMGDNRFNSADSRVWGFVPKKNLIGEAFFTFWPLNRMQILK